MQIEITLKNYRCFSDTKPATISLGRGFTGLVGVNNSGKSSLLKVFYEFRNLFETISYATNILNASRNPQVFNLGKIADADEIFCNNNDRNLELQIRIIDSGLGTTEGTPANRIDITIERGSAPPRFTAKIHSVAGMLNTTRDTEVHDTTLYTYGTRVELAGMIHVFKTLSKILYIGPFRNAINIGSNEDYFDIKVGQAFVTMWKNWKTGRIKKHSIATYKLTEDIKHIFEFKNFEINPSDDNQTLQVFIDGKSYTISEIGSGITQFILVLANAAIKQPSYILIDEPESNLHPSLQLDFLTTLGSYANEGVLFATHNIGLARASADRIYSVRKSVGKEAEVNKLESTSRLAEFIGELSFSGYRELGFDKILLVEGPEDVKAIQQFLRLYKKDHRIVLLPLGGNSLINGSSEVQLQEIKRISENVSALIDSERSTPDAKLDAARTTFFENCKNGKISCHILERRAIENYFSDRAIKRVKGEKYQALKPYESLKDISPTWAKAENWKIAREMTLEELNTTDLGKFLSSL